MKISIKKTKNSENIGSTACISYITIEQGKRVLYVGNVGDTRALLISKNSVKRLSFDHKCIEQSEEQRVKSVGGIIFNARVFGQLNLSRALGDHSLKNYGVIASPYTSRTVLTENENYLVMASDGVWDTILDDDMLNIFNENTNKNTEELANLIVKKSLELDSKDNISCIVIKFN